VVSNVSFRRSQQFRRTLSSDKGTEDAAPAAASNNPASGGGGGTTTLKAPPERGFGLQDNSVTVITIDSSGASANVSDEVFLPPVLQDRKSRAYGSLGSTAADGGVASFAAAAKSPAAAGQHTTAEVNVVTDGTNSEQTVQLSTPSSTLTKLAKGIDGSSERNTAETGSLITMTSDERVQIFVPSPSGGGTPYSTITKSSNQEFLHKVAAQARSVSPLFPRPTTTSISWHEMTSSPGGSGDVTTTTPEDRLRC